MSEHHELPACDVLPHDTASRRIQLEQLLLETDELLAERDPSDVAAQSENGKTKC